MAEANYYEEPRSPFMFIPYDVHVYIVKMLPLKDALAYSELTPTTREAVKYVFSHRKQLDFGSVLGPNGQIMLPDRKILQILYAHVRAEVITEFSVKPTFTAFTALKNYLQSRWIPMHDSDGWPTGVGHGVLCNLRYTTNSYCGGATPQQGNKLLAIWNEFDDVYGIFCVAYANFNHIPSIYTAPANWSTVCLEDLEDEDDCSDGSSLDAVNSL